MYNSQLSNNPFIDDPTNTSSRYPDINTLERSNSGYTSPGPTFGAASSIGSGNGFSGYSGTPGYGLQGYASQQQQPQFQQQPLGGWPQQNLASPYATGGYGSGPISPQMTALPYQAGFSSPQYAQPQQQYGGYGQSYPGPQYGGYSGLGQQSQQPQQQPQYLSEFDPLQTSVSSTFPSSNPSMTNTSGMHPREYIKNHKRELEQWDNVSWKQALNSFDSLKAAWELTKRQIEVKINQGGYYLGPVESQRLKGLQREAENHIDNITASTFQMQEVLEGYRVSSDFASRNRVRESMNAALQSLPDWPPQNW